MPIKEVQGNLLDSKCEALINTVNCVGVMGKGIALQFKKKWPSNFLKYKKACDLKYMSIGSNLVFDLGFFENNPRYIINFPTKDHWKDNSRLEYIDSGLSDLKRIIEEYKIKSIAVPPLGCGNGGLEWDSVKDLIYKYLHDLDTEIILYIPYSPNVYEIPINHTQPQMTISRAVLIKLMTLYRQLEYKLSKLEIQKLCYFAKEAGLAEFSKLRFQKHHFGPYADNLRHTLNDMEGHYIRGTGDNDKAQSEIEILDLGLELAEKVLTENPEALTGIQKVQNIIRGFETPYNMELLSTVHWALKHSDLKSLKAVTEYVQSWSERKKSLFSEYDIKVAYERLVSCC
ncbi:MAG: macro domain-containing protein [Candidatus Melainabacteria bacterium]|nr:macro domain-containing protein [Candidatus Melainabacteria bacterium]